MRFYKFYSADNPHSLENILNNQLYFATAEEFPDPLDSGLKIFDRIARETVFDLRESNVRILCLTSEESDYMWEHFGKGGNGFCLEYDENDIRKISKDIIKVEYHPEKLIEEKLNSLIATYVSRGFDKKVGICLLIAGYQYKRTDFQEEKEYRLLSKKRMVKGITPKRIIIGDKVDSELKKRVVGHCLSLQIKYELR